MADTTGVQVFVGPANQLELGDVTEGPTGVTLETIDASHQRINFTISAPTPDMVTAAEAAADAATASAASAATAQGNATTSATSAGNSATAAAGSQTAAQAAQAAAAAAQAVAAQAAADAGNAAADAVAAQAAAEAAEASAASMVPTDEELDAAVLRVITPATLLIDTDGRPYFA